MPVSDRPQGILHRIEQEVRPRIPRRFIARFDFLMDFSFLNALRQGMRACDEKLLFRLERSVCGPAIF